MWPISVHQKSRKGTRTICDITVTERDTDMSDMIEARSVFWTKLKSSKYGLLIHTKGEHIYLKAH